MFTNKERVVATVAKEGYYCQEYKGSNRARKNHWMNTDPRWQLKAERVIYGLLLDVYGQEPETQHKGGDTRCGSASKQVQPSGVGSATRGGLDVQVSAAAASLPSASRVSPERSHTDINAGLRSTAVTPLVAPAIRAYGSMPILRVVDVGTETDKEDEEGSKKKKKKEEEVYPTNQAERQKAERKAREAAMEEQGMTKEEIKAIRKKKQFNQESNFDDCGSDLGPLEEK